MGLLNLPTNLPPIQEIPGPGPHRTGGQTSGLQGQRHAISSERRNHSHSVSDLNGVVRCLPETSPVVKGRNTDKGILINLQSFD